MKRTYLLLLQTMLMALGAMAQADVTATLAGRAAILDNGIVRIAINAQGKVSSCVYEQTNLIGNDATWYFSCNEPDYHELTPTKAELKVNTADMAEVVYTNESPSGIKWSQGYIVRKGVSGIYTYLVAEGNSSNAALGEARMVCRVNDKLFNDGYVNAQMQGQMPSAATMAGVETSGKVQDATFRLPDGSIYTKYNWANYIKDDHFHGIMSSNMGFWSIPVSPEYINGGPMRQELMVHSDTKSTLVLQMLHGGHFGAGAQTYTTGDKKIYGPFFLYINKGTREEMIADAAAQATQQEQSWPFAWFSNELYPLDRATVSGTIKVKSYSEQKLRVVLAPSKDVYNEGKGYIYWAETDDNGNFSIPNVRKDTYTLTAYALTGINTDELVKTGIVVDEDNEDLGTIEWVAERYEHLLFSIGQANRLSDGYKLSDAQRDYSLFEQVPANLTYVVGESNPATDWYYAQTQPGTWTIKFISDRTYTGTIHLTAAVAASANYPTLTVNFNGSKVIDWNEWEGNDGSIYRSATQSGTYQLKQTTFLAYRVKKGENTLELKLNSIRGGNGGIMWDCIKMEAGSALTDGIRSLSTHETADEQWYTLQGLPVSMPRHGVYIHRGKKVFVR